VGKKSNETKTKKAVLQKSKKAKKQRKKETCWSLFPPPYNNRTGNLVLEFQFCSPTLLRVSDF